MVEWELESNAIALYNYSFLFSKKERIKNHNYFLTIFII